MMLQTYWWSKQNTLNDIEVKQWCKIPRSAELKESFYLWIPVSQSLFDNIHNTNTLDDLEEEDNQNNSISRYPEENKKIRINNMHESFLESLEIGINDDLMANQESITKMLNMTQKAFRMIN
jgi:hypothetical protein